MPERPKIPAPLRDLLRAPLRAPLRVPALLCAVALLFSLAACESESPEERVARVRADYEAELNSFQVRETPVAPVAPAPPSEADPDGLGNPEAGADPAGADPAAADPDAADPDAIQPLPDETAAVERDVLLDIMLRNRGDETLPGITLDIEQVGPQDQVKANYKVYVDASGASPGGQPAAVSYVLEDVDFAPGDKFAVEVRPTVPAEARGDYRELTEAAEASAP